MFSLSDFLYSQNRYCTSDLDLIWLNKKPIIYRVIVKFQKFTFGNEEKSTFVQFNQRAKDEQ